MKNHGKSQARYQVSGPEPKPVLTNAKRACKRTDRVTLTVGGKNEMNADRSGTVVFA
jgi:hypothetical protein